jgi:hypothetical protein
MAIPSQNYNQRRTDIVIVFLLALTYYLTLCAKQFTWLFSSGDSGDWLAVSHWWTAPQPFGSPLYVSLGHLLDAIPGDLVLKMTVCLSLLPAAITVTTVFAIVRMITNKPHIAVTSALILLGSSVFLSQSTILEEYALAVMFVVLGFWAYINNKLNWTAVSLGLGTAVHIMVLPIAVLWFGVNYKEWRTWAKRIPLVVVFGFLPYGLTLWELAYGEPLLVAGGGLSWASINSYLGSTSVVGSLAIADAPVRIGTLIGILVMSLGLAWIPILKVEKPMTKPVMMLIVCAGFAVWYYGTSMDPTTWTFLIYAMPPLAILAGIGAARMPIAQVTVISLCTLALIIANGFLLNADKLTKENPIAQGYVEDLQSLPDGSFVLTHRGGFETMALWYTMSLGKDLTPIYFEWEENLDDALWTQYRDWMHEMHGLTGDKPLELVYSALTQVEPAQVYVLTPLLDEWHEYIMYTQYVNAEPVLTHYGKIEAVSDWAEVHSARYLATHEDDNH